MTIYLPGAPELTPQDIPGMVAAANYLRIMAKACPYTGDGTQRANELKLVAGQLMYEVDDASMRFTASAPGPADPSE